MGLCLLFADSKTIHWQVASESVPSREARTSFSDHLNDIDSLVHTVLKYCKGKNKGYICYYQINKNVLPLVYYNVLWGSTF